MRTKNIPVTYVLFPDEGHGFERKANRLAFFAMQEAFLAIHLGNERCEPMPEHFGDSSMQLLEGPIPQLVMPHD